MAVAAERRGQQDVHYVTSAAAELWWALLAAHKVHLREEHPLLRGLYEESPGLLERVEGFWSGGPPPFEEVIVLADRAGLVAGTPPGEELLDRLIAAAEGGANPPLDSESPDDRTSILARLASLEGDRRLRSRYRQLLADVWLPLEPAWRATALPLAEAARRRVEHRHGHGRDWTENLIGVCEEWRHYLTEVVPARRVPVIVAIAAFAGRAGYLDLAGAVFCSFGAHQASHVDEERTAELGRRLRAVADPTRLALLRLLAEGPRRVGELAGDLELAQPTVSNHLKLLRESGIVTAPRRGGELVLDRAAFETLMGELGDLLGTRTAG